MALRSESPGARVIGSVIIPDSERLTLSTSVAWSSSERLRWMTPMPPSRARAIASLASVTVSMAAEMMGMRNSMELVSRVRVETSEGSTVDAAGMSSTSSKVRPWVPNFSSQSSSVVISVPDPFLLAPHGQGSRFQKRVLHCAWPMDARGGKMNAQ